MGLGADDDPVTSRAHRLHLARIAGRWRARQAFFEGVGYGYARSMAEMFSESARGCGLVAATDRWADGRRIVSLPPLESAP